MSSKEYLKTLARRQFKRGEVVGASMSYVKSLSAKPNSRNIGTPSLSNKMNLATTYYEWDKTPTHDNLPLGYIDGVMEPVSIDLTKGGLFIKGDMSGQAIKTILAGLVRIDSNVISVVLDPVNTLEYIDKFVAYKSSNKKDDEANIAEVLDWWMDVENINVPPNSILIVKNYDMLTGKYKDAVDTLAREGAEKAFYVIAESRGDSDGENFATHIEVDSITNNTSVSTSNTEKQVVPYMVKNEEIEYLNTPERTTIVEDNIFHSGSYKLHNALSEAVEDGYMFSEELINFIYRANDSNAIELAGEFNPTTSEEFLLMISNPAHIEISWNLHNVIGSLGKVAVFLDDKLEASVRHFDIPTKSIVEVNLESPTGREAKVFTDEELNDVFLKSIETGIWKNLAKLDDDSMLETVKLFESELGEVTVPPINEVMEVEPEVETEQSPKAVEKTEEVTANETSDTSTVNEIELEVYMEATGASREEAIKFLTA